MFVATLGAVAPHSPEVLGFKAVFPPQPPAEEATRIETHLEAVWSQRRTVSIGRGGGAAASGLWLGSHGANGSVLFCVS